MAEGFRILEHLLRVTALRHGVIASNIANADTPHYRAKDLVFGDALSDASLELRTTHVKHVSHNPAVPGGGTVVESGEPWADGNTVELDLEVGRMTENALRYQAGITMLSTKIRMFKSALRRQ
jgi:flagellar basal-body rod protein FlgB